MNTSSSSASVSSSATSGSSVSSFERSSFVSQKPAAATSSSSEITEPPKYEPYRPPTILQERTNPFDKNKAPSSVIHDTPKISGTGIYSSITSTSTPSSFVSTSTKTISFSPKPVDVTPPVVSSFTSSAAPSVISSGFDYSYRPSPIPIYKSEKSIEKVEEPKKVERTDSSGSIRGKLERKLSDADIIFGSKTEAFVSPYTSSYSRNRSNSSFATTSTDSDYNPTSREDLFKRENPFQKSLSVSSEKDGDFANDSRVRAYQGITNDAFKDSFDSPKESTYKPTVKPAWSNNDDDFDLK